jgi:hypothetical protein
MSDESSSFQNTRPLTVDRIATTEGASVLGVVCARLLSQHQQAHLFINQDGVVEVIPVEEVGLDLLSEQEALERLVALDYTDLQLESYLKARECRARRK